ncbi:MAG TPA: YCF48-related protein [Cellvibrio sp.]|nr:YCF48-related protein [Cellvibrio sp.]
MSSLHPVAQFYCLALVCCLGLSGCESKQQNIAPITENKPAVIQGLRVTNPAFFRDLHARDRVFIAGSDGTIIFSETTNPENISSLSTSAPAASKPTHHNQWQAANTGVNNNILGLTSNQNGTDLIAVGEDGLILHSTDAGNNWQIKASGTQKKLRTIVFDAEHQTWVAGGEEGIVLRSASNNLDKWTAVDTGQHSTLSAIYYLAAKKMLLAIGENGLLMSSTDGGSHWKTIPLPTQAALIQLISITGNNNIGNTAIIACADGSLLRSENDINNWEKITTSSSAYLTGLIYDPVHTTVLALSADGEILLSDDGGKLWAPVADTHEYLTDIALTNNGKKLLVSGAQGVQLQSDNGGRTWSTLPSLTSATIDGLVEISGQQLVAYGEGGLLLQSDDAGSSWSVLKTPITEFVHQLLKGDNDHWLAVGAKGLLISSTNQGQDWQSIASAQQTNDYFLSVVRDKKSAALAIAGPPGTVLVSNDEGKSWRVRLALGDANQGYFHQLLSDDKGTFVAIAGPGKIHFSADAGETWAASAGENSKQLFAGIYDQPGQQFIAVGQQGAIQNSRDGKNWQAINTGITHNMQAIYADKKTLWIGGEQGILLRSDDAGTNWEQIPTNITNTILTISQTRKGTLLATGNNGLILRSDDSGKHWAIIASTINDMLRKPVQDPATGIIYIASRAGTIIYSKDDGKHWRAMEPITQASIKTLAIDTDARMLLGGGERLIRIPLLIP